MDKHNYNNGHFPSSGVNYDSEDDVNYGMGNSPMVPEYYDYYNDNYNAVNNHHELSAIEQLRRFRERDPTTFESIKHLLSHQFIEEDNMYGRTTPLLYSCSHSFFNIDFPGLVIEIKPNANEGAIIELSSSQTADIGEYPGPLDLDKSLDADIANYLKDLVTEIQDSSPVNWDSGCLLIKFLDLYIKENGRPSNHSLMKLLTEGVETRTSELSKEFKSFGGSMMGGMHQNNMDNSQGYACFSRTSFSRASSLAPSRMSSRPPSPEMQSEVQPPSEAHTDDLTSSSSAAVNMELEQINQQQQQFNVPHTPGPGSVVSLVTKAISKVNLDQKYCLAMDKFRDYVFNGRFEDAIKVAAYSELWDHALALALQLNKRDILDDVLKRFCKRAIPPNDPLYTMHELLSSKLPKIVSVNQVLSNSEVNSWRTHLSMMLSTEKYKSHESRDAMEALGDKLILRCRDYYAGHLCYLLAGTKFGLPNMSSASANQILNRRRLELIGWSPDSVAKNTPGLSQRRATSAAGTRRRQNPHELSEKKPEEWWRIVPERNIKLTELFEYGLRLAGNIPPVVAPTSRIRGASKTNESVMNVDSRLIRERHESLSVHLATYKYTMVYRMLSRGQLLQAYLYCREMARIVEISHTSSSNNLRNDLSFCQIRDVLFLAKRLRHLLLQMFDETDLGTNDEYENWIGMLDREYKNRCAQLLNLPSPEFDLGRSLYHAHIQSNGAPFNEAVNRRKLELQQQQQNYRLQQQSQAQQPYTQAQPQPSHTIQQRQVFGPNSSAKLLPPPTELPTEALFNTPTVKSYTTSSMDNNPGHQYPQFTPSQQPPNPPSHQNQLEKQLHNQSRSKNPNQFSQVDVRRDSGDTVSVNNSFQQSFNSMSSTSHKITSYQQQNTFTSNNRGGHLMRNPAAAPNSSQYDSDMTSPQSPPSPTYSHQDNAPNSHNYHPQQHFNNSTNQRHQPNQSGTIHPPHHGMSHPNSTNQNLMSNELNDKSHHNDEAPSRHQMPSIQSRPQLPGGVPGMFDPSQAFRPAPFVPQNTSPSHTSNHNQFDMFNVSQVASRSRTQSTTSAGSNNNTAAAEQRHPPHQHSRPQRSRNNSESTTITAQLSSRHDSSSAQPPITNTAGGNYLERTVEESNSPEPDSQKENGSQQPPQSQDQQQANNAGGFFSRMTKYFPGSSNANKSKEVHLPDDTNQPLQYDEKTGKWIDTTNPDAEEEEVVKPPVMMAPPPAAVTPSMNSVSRYAIPGGIKTTNSMTSGAAGPPDILKMMPTSIYPPGSMTKQSPPKQQQQQSSMPQPHSLYDATGQDTSQQGSSRHNSPPAHNYQSYHHDSKSNYASPNPSSSPQSVSPNANNNNYNNNNNSGYYGMPVPNSSQFNANVPLAHYPNNARYGTKN